MATESTDPEVEVDAEYEQTRPEARSLPLNSRQLDAGHLQQLAVCLELPVNASMEKIRQMVDVKLTEMGKEPQIIQVFVQAKLCTEMILYLVDSEGMIRWSAPATRERNSISDRNEVEQPRSS